MDIKQPDSPKHKQLIIFQIKVLGRKSTSKQSILLLGVFFKLRRVVSVH